MQFFAASITFGSIIYIRFSGRKSRDAYIERMNANRAPFDKGWSFIPKRSDVKEFVNYN